MSRLGGFGATPQLPPEQRQIVSIYPMGDTLNEIRASIPQNIDSIYDYIASAQTNSDAQLLFGRLIGLLAFSPPAARLSNSNGKFSTQLCRFSTLWSQGTQLPGKLILCCSSLLQNVASNDPDVDVWNGVLGLLEEFSTTQPETPPDSSLKSPTFDTPAQPNSATSLAESQIRDEVDPYLRLELAGAVYTNVHGFGTRFGEQDVSAYWECAANCSSECAKGTKCPTK